MSRTTALDQFLDPVAALLTREVAERLVQFRADARIQDRLDELAEKCNEGCLSEEERRDYEAYVSAIDLVTVLQAKARRFLERQGAA